MFLAAGLFSSTAKGDSDFPFDIYKTMAAKAADKDLHLSPYSVTSALALVDAGAAGQTLEEMNALLGRTGTLEEFAAKMKVKEFADEKSPFRSFAGLWTQTGYAILPAYLASAQNLFNAEIGQFDFKNNPGEAVTAINKWVSERTNDKIPSLFDSLETATRVVVVSAVHFESNWRTPFDKKRTKKEDFTLVSGEKTATDMMYRKSQAPCYFGEDAAVLELPYKGDGYSMLVILPKSTADLPKLEASLSTEKIKEWSSRLNRDLVEVKMPKFTAQYQAELIQPLAGLGMKSAFSNAADFSGINGKTDLSISKVIHKVFIRVDETGTEAAAATGIGMRTTSIELNPPQPKQFIADRPFVYVIRKISGDDNPGTIMFVGRFAEPKK
jgi:serpin B